MENTWPKNENWFLVNKTDLSVRPLNVKARDCSNSVQEFFFDLGYLKFNSSSDVFIEVQKNGLHPLENKDCDHVPMSYLMAIESYLSLKDEKIVA
ncbi:hypothetical protein ATK78_0316 [Pedobacter metabolipauper]|uniref:Uncharacterized protein n=2 Tax=Pedobacter metabolipauper TaxID=425513 RepID=A0A4R6T143_9SPHI|nr:hypothetical protein ATK78_0316 [Pedobacter metabolipauper]